jgi:hypothetical protein
MKSMPLKQHMIADQFMIADQLMVADHGGRPCHNTLQTISLKSVPRNDFTSRYSSSYVLRPEGATFLFTVALAGQAVQSMLSNTITILPKQHRTYAGVLGLHTVSEDNWQHTMHPTV